MSTMTRDEILSAAKECVCVLREQEYGSPEENFALTAKFWSDYTGYSFEAPDVAVMMSLLKIARISTGTATADSFIDLAGYGTVTIL